jgi:penicillin-binding protein 1C
MKNFLKANLFSREKINRLIPFVKTKTAIALIVLLFSVIILDLLFPLPKPKPYSKVVYAKDNSLLSAYLSQDDKWRMRTRLDEVSPELKKAILEKEDSWFYWHLGVNPISVIRALSQNIFSGKRISGASTITMQVARMLEPGNRNYLNKFLEMLRAFQLELHYSKDDILEMYLSHLPYSGNIEGVKSASYIYFNRPPNKLSLSQAITLAVIPNDPNSLRLDKGNTEAVKQRNKWIKYFAVQKVFSPKDLRDALDEPLQTNRYQIKNEAPHFCQFVAQNFSQDEIFSSLSQQVQKTAEKILAGYVNRVKAQQVSNGSVIIIDNKTNSVVGYCGSADFNDASSAGQVNGINALRSPGSTLKPFLYTLAFDLGELTPKMKLLDIQTDFSGYEPENFDLTFNGPVTAEYALVN